MDFEERKGIITIEKDKENKGFSLLQRDEEKRLSINAIQIKLTYYQLIDFGYKLRKPRLNLKIKAQKNH